MQTTEITANKERNTSAELGTKLQLRRLLNILPHYAITTTGDATLVKFSTALEFYDFQNYIT